MTSSFFIIFVYKEVRYLFKDVLKVAIHVFCSGPFIHALPRLIFAKRNVLSITCVVREDLFLLIKDNMDNVLANYIRHGKGICKELIKNVYTHSEFHFFCTILRVFYMLLQITLASSISSNHKDIHLYDIIICKSGNILPYFSEEDKIRTSEAKKVLKNKHIQP